MFFVFFKLAPAPGDKKAKAVCLRLFRFISTRPAALPVPSPERGRVNGPVSSVGLSTEILPLETLGGVVRVELVSGVCLIPADNVVVFFGLGIFFLCVPWWCACICGRQRQNRQLRRRQRFEPDERETRCESCCCCEIFLLLFLPVMYASSFPSFLVA